MKKHFTLSPVILLSFFVISVQSSAQRAGSDSSRFDIGYLSLNRNFTQHVSIRGEDLEKMPFSNLSDAIRAWLFGAYTTPTAIAYVVDGNPVTDVNIYPIFEIEEVTLVNNALATAAYGNSQKELVLITTRRRTGKEGMQFAAQTGLVKDNSGSHNTNSGLYHHYYLGAYENRQQVSYGASADWLRDFEPVYRDPTVDVVTSPNLQRWRFNGWLDWRPDARNVIGLKLGYAPQSIQSDLVYGGTGHVTQKDLSHLLVPALTWEGSWGRGLRNKFDVEYLLGAKKLDDQSYSNSPPNYSSGGNLAQYNAAHLIFRDRLGYEAVAGKWHILPAIDISYDRIGDKRNIVETQYGYTAGPFGGRQELKGSLFYLTPAVDFTLARVLDIHAGLFVNASSRVDSSNRRFFPFVTVSEDLLHSGGETGDRSLKLFGSYARRPAIYIDDYSLSDLSYQGAPQDVDNIYYGVYDYEFLNGYGATPQDIRGPQPGYWAWQTGVAYASRDKRFSAQYSLEQRKFCIVMAAANAGVLYAPWTTSFHRTEVRFRVVDDKKINWLTGLNVNLMRAKNNSPTFVYNYYPLVVPVGDVYPAKYSWTGGWVNRLTAGCFTAGLDLTYHLGVATLTTGYVKNTVVLPNLYAGYRWELPHARRLEVFVESRGLVMNTSTALADGRRFYTAGGNFNL